MFYLISSLTKTTVFVISTEGRNPFNPLIYRYTDSFPQGETSLGSE